MSAECLAKNGGELQKSRRDKYEFFVSKAPDVFCLSIGLGSGVFSAVHGYLVARLSFS
jgi:hypothetical protein